MGKASIKDVATAAGVSIATVSQILNGKGERFSAATQAKVLQARDEIGYVPNFSARSLKQGDRLVVGVVVPSLRNPFFGDIVQSMQETHPENVALSITASDGDHVEQTVKELVAVGVNGIILAREPKNITELAEYLDRRGIALTVLEHLGGEQLTDRVDSDDFSGGQQVAAHLADLGHRQVGVTVPAQLSGNLARRIDGFETVMANVGGTVTRFPVDFMSKHDGMAIADAVQAAGVTAMFAVNDELAFGLMKGLQLAGVSVPDAISVVGYDDTDYAAYVTPALTTVTQPARDLGPAALTLVLNRITKPKLDPQNKTFNVRLVVRDSTAPVNG